MNNSDGKNWADGMRKLVSKLAFDDTDTKTDADINDVSNYFSSGVKKIGIKNVLWCFKRVIKKNPGADIVSLGSGNGVIEKIIDDTFGCDIICIDPHFNEFLVAPIKFTKKPAFKTINEYNSHRDENGQSNKKLVLFINWTFISLELAMAVNPKLATCEMYNYDYGAIAKTKPNHVISIYDPTGAAGSKVFTAWANKKCSVPSLSDSWLLDNIDKKDIHLPGYHYVGQILHTGEDMFGAELYARLIWLSRDPFNSVYDFPLVG